jgi:hypothetical protein
LQMFRTHPKIDNHDQLVKARAANLAAAELTGRQMWVAAEHRVGKSGTGCRIKSGMTGKPVFRAPHAGNIFESCIGLRYSSSWNHNSEHVLIQR